MFSHLFLDYDICFLGCRFRWCRSSRAAAWRTIELERVTAINLVELLRDEPGVGSLLPVLSFLRDEPGVRHFSPCCDNLLIFLCPFDLGGEIYSLMHLN